MHFRYTDIQAAIRVGAPSHEEIAMFECLAKGEVEEGQNLLDTVVRKDPSRLYYLFTGLLKDQPQAAFKVASEHLSFLNGFARHPSEPSDFGSRKLKAKSDQLLPASGLECVSEEDLLVLKAIPVLKPTPYMTGAKENK